MKPPRNQCLTLSVPYVYTALQGHEQVHTLCLLFPNVHHQKIPLMAILYFSSEKISSQKENVLGKRKHTNFLGFVASLLLTFFCIIPSVILPSIFTLTELQSFVPWTTGTGMASSKNTFYPIFVTKGKSFLLSVGIRVGIYKNFSRLTYIASSPLHDFYGFSRFSITTKDNLVYRI